MKMLKQLTGMLLAAAASLFALPAAAHAAEGQPHILLNASGVEGQYILRLEEFGSRFESVQFAIAIDREVPAPQVKWEDDSPAHFQQVDTRSENGKTVLTVYIDRLRPIANSGSVDLAALTFSQPLPAGAFSAEGGLLALDGNQEETLFSAPTLSVSGVSAGDPSDPPASSSGSSSSSGGSEDSEGSEGGGSSSSRGSEDSEGSEGGSSRGPSEKTVLRWEDVSTGRTSEVGGKKALTIRVSEGQVISSQIFLQAQRQGLLLRLDYGDYIWIFDTTKEIDIPSGRVFYDLSIKPLHFRNLSAAVQGSDLLQFEIVYSGALPCPATLSCRAGSSYAGETVHLSYYNEKEASLDFRESAQVGEDGWVSFAFTHASRYVVSQRDFWSAPAQPAAGAAGAVVGTAASPVIVVPEDTLADAGQDTPEAEQEPEPEPEDSPSGPDEEPEEESAAPAAGRNTRDNGNVIPLLILFLSAAAAAILLLQMYTSKKRRR